MSDIQEVADLVRSCREERAKGSAANNSTLLSYHFSLNRILLPAKGEVAEKMVTAMIDAGWIALFLEEIAREPVVESSISPILTNNSVVCLKCDEKAARKLLNSGMAEHLALFAMRHAPGACASNALLCLRNFTMKPSCQESVKAMDLLPVYTNLLQYLPSEDPNELQIGLHAASLICRLYGNDESGPGAELIKSNDLIINKMHWFLTEVLDVGENGFVNGVTYNPAGLMYDISILCTADRNKPLLGMFVPLIARAMNARFDNQPMINYAVLALNELLSEPKCKVEFEKIKVDLVDSLDKIIASSSSDPHTLKSASTLRKALLDSDKPRSASTSMGIPVLRDIIGKFTKA